MSIKMVDAQTAKGWIETQGAILIDVREPAEHAAQNIAAAHLVPLGSVTCASLPSTAGKIIIHCQKGMRGNKACEALLAENADLDVYNLEGGIEAWQEVGLATQSGS